MKRIIPYGQQSIDENDISAVVDVLRSDWITQGPLVDEFEARVAAYCGARYAVAFNSGTSALHGALHAAGIGPGDEVISSPITFLASTNAALYVGAKPIFVDMDPRTYCIDINKIEAAITEKTRAVIPVDYAGYPVDMDKILEIARRHDLVVIEDAAHALGAMRKNKMLGNQADMTVLSFHPVKHITTGEGGMVVTDSEDYYRKLMQLRSHGMVKDKARLIDDHGPWYYEMQDLGYNYRLTDIQCALGISQLKKLEFFVKERNTIAAYYDQAFTGIEQLSIPPQIESGNRNAYHLYPLLLAEGLDRRAFFEYMRSQQIGVQVHYIPVHLQPYYQKKFGYKTGDFPVAEDFYRREISLPIYPGLSREEQAHVIKLVKDYLNQE